VFGTGNVPGPISFEERFSMLLFENPLTVLALIDAQPQGNSAALG
jgi:hypothetical protein